MKKKILSVLLALTMLGTTAVFNKSAENPLSINAEAATSGKLRKPDCFSAKVKGKKITLSWQEVDGADAYGVYMYNAAKKKYVKLKNTKETVLTVNVKEEGTYKFRVYSLDKTGKKYKKGNYAFRAVKVVVDRYETEFKNIEMDMTKKEVLVEIDGTDYEAEDGFIMRTIKEDEEFAVYYFDNNKLYAYGFAYPIRVKTIDEFCEWIQERGWIKFGQNTDKNGDRTVGYKKDDKTVLVMEDSNIGYLLCLVC